MIFHSRQAGSSFVKSVAGRQPEISQLGNKLVKCIKQSGNLCQNLVVPAVELQTSYAK